MQAWNVLHAACWKCRTQKSPKICHLGTIAELYWATSSQLRHVSTIGKKSINSNISPTCPCNMVNFGLLAAEMVLLVWGTRDNMNWVRVLAALLHSTLVVRVSKLCGIEQRAPPIFGTAAITLGSGPHSSCVFLTDTQCIHLVTVKPSQQHWTQCDKKRQKSGITRMWANAQRDVRPAEYKWRPLFNAALWLTPTTRVPCSNSARETR